MHVDFCGHIAVPTDFSSEALYAFRRACELARAIQARVSLLHVVAPIERVSLPVAGFDALGLLHSAAHLAPADDEGQTRVHRSLSPESAVERRLRDWSQVGFSDDLVVNAVLRTGDRCEEILRYLSDSRVTLAVLGVRRARRWFPWGRTRLSDTVSRRSPTPVLLVPNTGLAYMAPRSPAAPLPPTEQIRKG